MRTKREMSTKTRAYLRELRAERRARRRTEDLHRAVEAEADAWNARHPIGTEVVVTRYDGSEMMRTRTRSIAWRICDHASVMVEGISGGYLLKWVRPVEGAA